MRRPQRRLLGRGRAVAAALGALALGMSAQPMLADASTTITTYHVASVGYSSFAITANSVGSGWYYRLYASTTKSNVYASNLSKALHSSLSSTTTTKLTSLGYTTAPYWFRVVATKGTSRRTGPISSIGLRPTAPTSFAITNSTGRLPQLHWSSVTTTGFQIEQATNSTFSTGVHYYTTRDNLHRFTPYLVTKGTLYYYRVRGINDGTRSAYSSVVGSSAKASAQSVKVMTYNVLTDTSDNTPENDFTIPNWHTTRRDGAVQLIQQEMPDLITVQEASGWVPYPQSCDPSRCIRMADDLVNALGGQYALAQTEPVPGSVSGWYRTGDYILYNTATMRAVGSGGHFTVGYLPSSKAWFGVYQAFQSLGSGAQVFFVGTHLAVGTGSASDTERENETKSLLSQTASVNTGGLPVVYAGDFNSHPYPGHVDGPGVAMWQAGIATADDVAQSVSNAKYDSANEYKAVPPAFGDNIDHVFVPQGLGVQSWKLVIDLVNGRFPSAPPSDHNPVVTTVAVPF